MMMRSPLVPSHKNNFSPGNNENSDDIYQIINQIKLLDQQHDYGIKWQELHHQYIEKCSANPALQNSDETVFIIAHFLEQFEPKQSIALMEDFMKENIGLKHSLWLSSYALHYEQIHNYVKSGFILQNALQNGAQPQIFLKKSISDFQNRMVARFSANDNFFLGELNDIQYYYEGKLKCIDKNNKIVDPEFDLIVFCKFAHSRVINEKPGFDASQLLDPETGKEWSFEELYLNHLNPDLYPLIDYVERRNENIPEEEEIQFEVQHFNSRVPKNESKSDDDLLNSFETKPFKGKISQLSSQLSSHETVHKNQPSRQVQISSIPTNSSTSISNLSVYDSYKELEDFMSNIQPKPILKKSTEKTKPTEKSSSEYIPLSKRRLKNSSSAISENINENNNNPDDFDVILPKKKKPYKSPVPVSRAITILPPENPEESNTNISVKFQDEPEERMPQKHAKVTISANPVEIPLNTSNDIDIMQFSTEHLDEVKPKSILKNSARKSIDDLPKRQKLSTNFSNLANESNNSNFIRKSINNQSVENDDDIEIVLPKKKKEINFGITLQKKFEETNEKPDEFQSLPKKSILKQRSITPENEEEIPVLPKKTRIVSTLRIGDVIQTTNGLITIEKQISRKSFEAISDEGHFYFVKLLASKSNLVGLSFGNPELFSLPLPSSPSNANYIITEFYSNGNFQSVIDIIKSSKRLDEVVVLFFTWQMLKMLSVLEKMKLVHGMIDPEHLLMRIPKTQQLNQFEDDGDPHSPWSSEGLCLTGMDHIQKNGFENDRKSILSIFYEMTNGNENGMPRKWNEDIWKGIETTLGTGQQVNGDIDRLIAKIAAFLLQERNRLMLKSKISSINIAILQ